MHISIQPRVHVVVRMGWSALRFCWWCSSMSVSKLPCVCLQLVSGIALYVVVSFCNVSSWHVMVSHRNVALWALRFREIVSSPVVRVIFVMGRVFWTNIIDVQLFFKTWHVATAPRLSSNSGFCVWRCCSPRGAWFFVTGWQFGAVQLWGVTVRGRKLEFCITGVHTDGVWGSRWHFCAEPLVIVVSHGQGNW